MIEIELPTFWPTLKPQVVAWLVAEHDGRRSICPVAWSMRTSSTPPLMAVSVAPSRFTHGLIEGAGEFVLAYPGRELAEATLLCGSRSGRDVDKLAATGVSTVPARHVRAPLIRECVAQVECRVVDRLVTGDHTIFVGEVLAAWRGDATGPLLCVVDDTAGYETAATDGRFRLGVVR